MTIKEQLAGLLKSSQDMATKLFDDLSEDESMDRGQDASNHARWQVGHLAYFADYVLYLAGKTDESAKSMEKDFGYQSEIRDDATSYAPMAELLGQLKNSQKALSQLVDESTEDELNRLVKQGEKEVPLSSILGFLALHEAYHAGQMIAVRRSLGRKRPFG